MARKKSTPLVGHATRRVLCVRVPYELVIELQETAEREGITVSRLAEKLLSQVSDYVSADAKLDQILRLVRQIAHTHIDR